MDPNQQNNSSGGLTDTPTPEVTPTPTPDSTSEIVSEVTPGLGVSTAEPSALESAPIEQSAPVLATEPATEPSPVTPNPLSQPAVSDGVGSGPSTLDTPPKSKKGLIIGLIAGIGGLLIIGVVLFMFVFSGGGQIKNFAELKDAFKNHKAMNCTYTASQNGVTAEVLYQTDDSWNHLHVKVPSVMGGVEEWAVREGDKYTVYGTIAGDSNKTTISIDKFNERMNSLGEGDAAFTEDSVKDLKCEPNSRADFKIPDDVDFKELSINDSGD